MRAGLIATHGNRMILYRVFNDSRLTAFDADGRDIEADCRLAAKMAMVELRLIAAYVATSLPNAYPQTIFKNFERCKEIDEALDRKSGEQPFSEDEPLTPDPTRGLLFH